MRILVDECVDPRIKRLFADHETATVHEKEWDTLDDGALLAAAQDQFDILLTIDRGLEFQQNIAKFHLGVVVVHVPKNQIAHYEAIQQEILLAIESVNPGEVRHVPKLSKREIKEQATEFYSIAVSGSMNGQITVPARYTAARV